MATISDTPAMMFLGSHFPASDPAKKVAMQAMIRRVQKEGAALFQETAEERKRIAEWLWDNASDDVLGEMEVFSDTINGYVSWLDRSSGHPHPQQAVQDLQVHSLADHPILAKFLENCGLHYPKLCAYMELQDYLRALMMAYLVQFEHARLLVSEQEAVAV